MTKELAEKGSEERRQRRTCMSLVHFISTQSRYGRTRRNSPATSDLLIAALPIGRSCSTNKNIESICIPLCVYNNIGSRVLCNHVQNSVVCRFGSLQRSMAMSTQSMAMAKVCRSLLSSTIRRHVSTAQQATASRANAGSYLLRMMEDRRRKVQQEDIRLEPYMSKGVYTESGAIRPVSETRRFSVLFWSDL
jgi:hypothetical protein